MTASRYNSLSQLASVMAGFVFTILLLESEALQSWAQRLEVGNAASIAIQATTALERVLRPVNIVSMRRESLAGLDRLGWTDDPARLQAARSETMAASVSPVLPCTAVAAAGAVKASPLRGTSMPVAPGIPRQTSLPRLPPLAAGQHRVVALVGDSMMAVGLSDTLLRQTSADQNLQLIKAFRSGTGLARPDVFDWMKEYPAMIGSQQPDSIIVAIGANDGQGFVEDGKVLAFGSDAWVKVYQQRTAAFLSLLTQNGAHIVWVGLPPMKSGKYNEKIAEINRITYTVVSQYPQVSWWNPALYIGDESGAYRDFQTTSDGRTTRLRAPDGIHLSDEGAALLTPSLVNWLNATPPTLTAQVAGPDGPAKPRSDQHSRAARH